MDPDDLLQDDVVDKAVPLDPNDPDNLKKLTEREDSPTAPPDDVIDTRSDHQQKDVIDNEQQVYDEGEDSAAGLNDPLRDKVPNDFAPEDADAEGFDADGTEEASKDSPGEVIS